MTLHDSPKDLIIPWWPENQTIVSKLGTTPFLKQALMISELIIALTAQPMPSTLDVQSDASSPGSNSYSPQIRASREFKSSRTISYFGTAYLFVHSLAVAMAAASFSFQLFATSGASGSSGLGAPRRAWIERRIVRIWRAGDQLSCPC